MVSTRIAFICDEPCLYNQSQMPDLTIQHRVFKINWDRIYREQAPRLKGICRRYVGDEALAEDLVQETFETAIDKLDTFRQWGSVEGWIRKIAINKCLLSIRARKETVPVDTLATPEESDLAMETSPNNVRVTIESASFSTSELLEVVDHLPVHHKAVFNLYVIDGFSHKQIAQMLSISQGTSKSHLARARKKTQEMLYAKAVEQPRQEIRRRDLAVLLLFSPHYIDRIFRKGLSGIRLPLGLPAPAFPSVTASALKWGYSLSGSLLIGGAVLTTALLVYRTTTSNHRTPEKPIISTVNELPADSQAVRPVNNRSAEWVKAKTDTAVQVSTSDTLSRFHRKRAKKKPVVVRKTIVVHDTVFVEKPPVK